MMESCRHKTNHSELKVKTSHIDLNFDSEKEKDSMDNMESAKLIEV